MQFHDVYTNVGTSWHLWCNPVIGESSSALDSDAVHSSLGLLVSSDLRGRIFSSRRGEGPRAGKDAVLEGERQTGCRPGLLDRVCWELWGWKQERGAIWDFLSFLR